MSGELVKSIHPTLAKAIRSARYWGGTVKQNVRGTTPDKPWAVVAPAPDKKERGG